MRLKIQVVLLLLLSVTTVNLRAQVVAAFDADTTLGCGVLELSMINLSTDATTYSWQVYNSSGTLVASSTLTNPSFFLTTPDDYTVTLTATGPGGSDTFTADDFASVVTPPNAVIEVDPTSGCPPVTITAENLSTPGSLGSIESFYWIITGAGSLPATDVINYTFETSGTYSVFLFVQDEAGCSDFAEVLVIPDPAPAIDFTADETISCEEPFTVNFDNLSTGDYMPFTYLWDFGDGTTSTLENPSHEYASFGFYDVTLTATNTYGCTTTFTADDFVQIDPEVAIDFVPSSYAVCLGDTVFFDNLAGSAFGDWTWDFGDGSTSTDFEPFVVYDAVGTYSVSLDAYFGLGCSGAISYPSLITVGAAPTVSFTSTDTYSACELPFAVSFTPVVTGVGPFDYFWEFELPDGTFATATAPFPTYSWTAPGTYDVTLTVTSSSGCVVSYTASDLVTIDTLVITPEALPSQGCIPFSTEFVATATEDLVSWHWFFGDGASSFAENPSHTYYDDSCYTVTFIGTTVNGCTDTVVLEDYVCAGFTGAAGGVSVPDTSCPGVPLDLDIFPVDSIIGYIDGTGATSYTDFIDSLTFLDLPIGFHSIELITYSSGCPDTLYFDIFIVDVSDTSLGTDYSCLEPLTVYFSMDTLLADSSCGWLWHFGDGETDTTLNPIHIYDEPGIYETYAELFCVSLASCVGGTRELILTDPIALFEMPQMSCDTPFTIDFVNLSSDGVSETLDNLWNFDDGSADTTEAPSHTFTDYGQYIVSLTITDTAECTAQFLDTLIINKLEAFFEPSETTACVPAYVNLDDGSSSMFGTIQSWVVDWDDGEVDTFYSAAEMEAALHFYDTKAAYLIELTVTDDLGCITSYKDTVIVTQPVADFVLGDTVPCLDEIVVFEELATGSGITYLWDFGDGTTSTEANPEHSYGSYGAFDVTLIVTDDNGCSDTTTKIAYVNVDSILGDITYDELVSSCNYSLVQFYVTTDDTICSYDWDFGDGFGGSGTSSPIYPYLEAGIYDVSVTLTTCSGCVGTLTEEDFILVPGPYGSLEPLEDTVCIGNDAIFQLNFSSTDTATIFYGNGDFGELDLPYQDELDSMFLDYAYDTSGIYVVSILLVDTNGCFNVLDLPDSLWVGFPPNSIYAVDSGGCLGTEFFFDEGSTGLDPIVYWSWDIGDSVFVDTSGADFYYTYTEAGIYNTSLIVSTALGCADTLEFTVGVLDTPTVNISPDTVICPGNFVTLSAEDGIVYSWSPPDGLDDPTSDTPSASPDATTTYSVVVSNGYCEASDTVQVRVLEELITNAGPDTALCLLGGVQLYGELVSDVPPDQIEFTWFPPTELSATDILDPYSSSADDITYYLIASCGTLSDTADAQIQVVAPPDVEIAVDSILLIQDEVAQINASLLSSSSAVTYNWFPPDQINCNNCSSVFVSPDVTTVYSVEVIDENGCTDIDFVYVRVMPCDETLMFIPNIISPNNDGMNDIFRITYEGITLIEHIYVYDRWGELVAESKDPNKIWDGTYKGELCNPGVYVYVIEAICVNDAPNIITGNITLVR